MSEFRNRANQIRGPRRRLWHFNGHETRWKINVRDSANEGGMFSSSRASEYDDRRLMHYIRFGSLHSDIAAEENQEETVDRKSTILKWLIALAILWVLFFFVEL